MTTFKLEMTSGQEQRIVEADSWRIDDDWLVFYRKPATGGYAEYWRVQRGFVVCFETKAS